eukprot:6041727-Prymnesium_polylepis.1
MPVPQFVEDASRKLLVRARARAHAPQPSLPPPARRASRRRGAIARNQSPRLSPFFSPAGLAPPRGR